MGRLDPPDVVRKEERMNGPGIETLFADPPAVFNGTRIGLVTHAASLCGGGQHAASVMARHPELDLRVLFAPEHGFAATAGAGEKVGDMVHSTLGLPIRSLYGEFRKPTPEMLADIDVLVVDLQDLAVRCYTYASTLDLVMEAAVEAGLPVVVCDRPVPVPGLVDGPMLDPDCMSFVGRVPTPYCFGRTQGELAHLLVREKYRELDLTVFGLTDGPAAPWVPPSPGIRSWETAVAYPATVFCEALPAFDVDRTGLIPFQVWTASFLQAAAYAKAMNARELAGVFFEPYGGIGEGVRLCVHDAHAFRPAATAVHLMAVAQEQAGSDALWEAKGVREEFFDQLWGSHSVRVQLQEGSCAFAILEGWEGAHTAFCQNDCLPTSPME